VQLSPQNVEVPRSNFTFDFDLERKIIEDAERGNWERGSRGSVHSQSNGIASTVSCRLARGRFSGESAAWQALRSSSTVKVGQHRYFGPSIGALFFSRKSNHVAVRNNMLLLRRKNAHWLQKEENKGLCSRGNKLLLCKAACRLGEENERDCCNASLVVQGGIRRHWKKQRAGVATRIRCFSLDRVGWGCLRQGCFIIDSMSDPISTFVFCGSEEFPSSCWCRPPYHYLVLYLTFSASRRFRLRKGVYNR
jgi:hypothetical protein